MGNLRENGFCNKAFNSIEAVEDELMQSLEALEKNPESVASMTRFPRTVSINLNAR